MSDPEDAANDFYCKEVLSGNTPVEVVAETQHVLAFRHTRPHYDVHVVVVPKEHVVSLIARLDELPMPQRKAIVQEAVARVELVQDDPEPRVTLRLAELG